MQMELVLAVQAPNGAATLINRAANTAAAPPPLLSPCSAETRIENTRAVDGRRMGWTHFKIAVTGRWTGATADAAAEVELAPLRRRLAAERNAVGRRVVATTRNSNSPHLAR